MVGGQRAASVAGHHRQQFFICIASGNSKPTLHKYCSKPTARPVRGEPGKLAELPELPRDVFPCCFGGLGQHFIQADEYREATTCPDTVKLGLSLLLLSWC